MKGTISRIPYSVSRILPLKEFVIGLKFAGRRQPRFFPRFSRGSSALRNAPSFTASYIALGLAGLCGIAWVAVALLGDIFGVWAAVPVSFPFLFLAHLARADFTIGWWAIAALLVLGVVWIYPARRLRRRAFDALLTAFLVLEIWFLLRWLGLLSPPAGVPHWEALSAGERCSLILALSCLLLLLAAWMLRPGSGKSYQMSAPTRVTGFLKKRRRSLRFAGGLLMAVALSGVFIAGQVAFGGEVPGVYRWGEYRIYLAPAIAAGIFVACDGLYILGRYYWYRLS